MMKKCRRAPNIKSGDPLHQTLPNPAWLSFAVKIAIQRSASFLKDRRPRPKPGSWALKETLLGGLCAPEGIDAVPLQDDAKQRGLGRFCVSPARTRPISPAVDIGMGRRIASTLVAARMTTFVAKTRCAPRCPADHSRNASNTDNRPSRAQSRLNGDESSRSITRIAAALFRATYPGCLGGRAWKMVPTAARNEAAQKDADRFITVDLGDCGQTV